MFGNKDKRIKELERRINTLESLSSLTENQLKEKLTEKLIEEEREKESKINPLFLFVSLIVFVLWALAYISKNG